MKKQIDKKPFNNPSGLGHWDNLTDCFKRADRLSDPYGRWHSGMIANRKDLRRIVLLVKEVRNLQKRLEKK